MAEGGRIARGTEAGGGDTARALSPSSAGAGLNARPQSAAGARDATWAAGSLPDSRGANLYRADPSFGPLLRFYLGQALYAHLEPHLVKLGALAGGELDELAATADRHPPRLHLRDRTGECCERIEKPCGFPECTRCDPATGSCMNVNEGRACDDFNECTAQSRCAGNGLCVAGVPTLRLSASRASARSLPERSIAASSRATSAR